MKHILLTTAERQLILDRLYNSFVSMGDLFNDPHLDRADKKRIRTDRRFLARLINKLEGRQEVEIELPEDENDQKS